MERYYEKTPPVAGTTSSSVNSHVLVQSQISSTQEKNDVDLENLQSDPGLRPNILSYPPSLIEELDPISNSQKGHINPFTSLALKLASKGFAVTFVHYEYVHHLLLSKSNQVELFSEARESGLDIRCATISDGLPLEFDRALHFMEFYEAMLNEIPVQAGQLVGKIIDSDPSLEHFLVTDTFYSWPAIVAKKYNIVNVSFWTQPALVFSLGYHFELLGENGHFPLEDGIEEEVDYVPGIQSINTRDLMPYLKDADVSGMTHRFVFRAFKEVKKADFILHNTVSELESATLSALNKYQPNYAIGPVNFFKNTASMSMWSESNCTVWLDSKPPGSVLYISFGSLVETSKQVFEEVAHGLLLSGANFIWVVRTGVTGSIFPEGFESGIKDRGLIIPWCNQLMVLSNPAVGGFLTHCGWNSILESVWCGVPMICYPITYDQPTNRKLVVDDLRVGINLCDNGASVEREGVGNKIKQLMSGTDLSLDMEKARAKLVNAVKSDGSSEKNFGQFIEDLKAQL